MTERTLSALVATVLTALLAVGCTGGGLTVNLEATDQMAYSLDRIDATAGQQVTINLQHVGSLPVETMGHNFVLLAEGTDLAAFAAAAAEAGADANYIPPAMADQVIASSDMIGGGARTSLTFTAPAAGTYKFICSFPGHFGMMQGDFVVTE